MFFFSSFRFSARMCPFVCGRKTIDFSVVVQTGRAQKCGGGGGGGPPVAREKKRRRKSRRVHSLAREVAELFRARPSRPEWFFRFPEGRLGRKTEDKFCASAGFIFFLSRLLKEPGRTKEEEKRALIYAKENESTTKTHETPSFFLEPKQTTDRHRDHGAGCSLHRLPGSVPRGAKRRRASRRRRTVVGRRRLGRDFVLLFVLVGARRVGTIGLVREREKRNKVRNHSKSTQNTSEREKKECVCIDKTRENERERERG